MKHQETFKMTYSAQQQAEIQEIRQKYVPRETDKMEQLRALDAKATNKATSYSIAIGILGALLLGCGMSFTMSDLGIMFGWWAMPIGIAVGIVGIGIVACAYPLYRHTLQKEREKIAPEILRLTDELMQ